MAILSFTLSPESLGRLHDVLVCLGKFSESVSIEAAHDKLLLYSLNSSKSAYAAFTLARNSFFSKYQYTPARSRSQEKFNCKIYNKALLSVFKGRSADPEKDTAIERCDVSVEDGDGVAKSRFIIKIVCRHGVLKTYRLTFESVPASHAIFMKESANNRWSISSKTLREFVDHFGPGTEQLDIYSEDGRVSFTSYTEKIMSGNEILKQPLHTTIAIDTQEFTEFAVEEKLHLVTSVKDFKSIITHAGTTHTVVHARYSRPSNPLQLTYSDEGITSEFILMTIGDSRGASATPAPAARASNRPASRQPPALEAARSSRRSGKSAEMPPPPARAGSSLPRNASRPSPPPPQPSIQSNALFLPEEDEDRRWDPVTYDDEEDQEMLLWDDAAANSGPRLQASEKQSQSINGRGKSNGGSTNANPTPRIAPTQGLSQVRGIFDD